ncbi:hypothetical protein SteCoe_20903 [Stentor coeruleus]|uniref:Major facilitator superfamily (MFS) profile domain-containing protein n=1 Tax=Stentor coeruleus TaxID=5963 RepID=A0A1R2BR04_9CILI|nr:hypothetical protein SteCoe_20903 [Stentor coeruleus]
MGVNVFLFTFLCEASKHVLMAGWFNCAGEVHKKLGISSEKLGMIDMSFLICYAVGNFIFGILGDMYHQKKVLCICSLIAGGIFSTIILLSYFQIMTFALFTVLFAVFGLFLSSIWPMVVSIMGQEYPHAVRGKVIGLWSVNSAIGDIIGYFISSLLLHLFSSWILVLSIVILQFFVIILCTFFFMKSHDSPLSKPNISILDALKTPTVFSYCICYACVKLLHMAILIWIPYYLEVELAINIQIEGVLMILYSIGGVFGSVVSGHLSDKVADRSFVLMFMLIGAFPIIILLSFVLGTSNIISCIVCFVTGILIGGGSSLLCAVVAADMGDLNTTYEAKSIFTGFVNAFGSIGASLGQYIIGLLQGYSWGVFGVMLVTNALGIGNLAPVVYRAYKKRSYREFNKEGSVGGNLDNKK